MSLSDPKEPKGAPSLNLSQSGNEIQPSWIEEATWTSPDPLVSLRHRLMPGVGGGCADTGKATAHGENGKASGNARAQSIYVYIDFLSY